MNIARGSVSLSAISRRPGRSQTGPACPGFWYSKNLYITARRKRRQRQGKQKRAD